MQFQLWFGRSRRSPDGQRKACNGADREQHDPRYGAHTGWSHLQPERAYQLAGVTRTGPSRARRTSVAAARRAIARSAAGSEREATDWKQERGGLD